MLSARVFTISTILVALICVILAVTAAPLAPVDDSLIKRKATTNQTTLQADSIPVSSTGDGSLKQYNPDDTVTANVTKNGNSGEGDGNGQK